MMWVAFKSFGALSRSRPTSFGPSVVRWNAASSCTVSRRCRHTSRTGLGIRRRWVGLPWVQAGSSEPDCTQQLQDQNTPAAQALFRFLKLPCWGWALICVRAGRPESFYAGGDIHSVETVTQTTQRRPTIKKNNHSGSDHRNSKWFNIICHVIYIVPGTGMKN